MTLMKTFALLLATAASVVSFGATAHAASHVDITTLTCTDFLAMDSAGMMAAGEAMAMADDAMAGDAMADDAMADDAMADDAMEGDMTAKITDACKAHPDAKVADASAM
jgi:hypothetical protein